MKQILPVICLLVFHVAAAQDQVCPLNNNFSYGNLTHWLAYTGNNASGNPATDTVTYDSTKGAPSGTIGVSSISEFNLPGTPGIQVITVNSKDPYGNFYTIPKINGYQYAQTILLGSTQITHSSGRNAGGGYVRGVSYRINVPAGAPGEPYTMTYAYAMVLENGTHNSDEQPLFSATLRAGDSIVHCASPQYYLPTLDNAVNGGVGATLDTAVAEANGFFPSRLPSPNANPNGGGSNQHLYDVWAKGWTEVTFDLGPYRGQQVELTFETDNCVPGGHFAYSYIAIRNTCGGLLISGDSVACQGSTLTYSVPSLAGASYQWTVPGDWSIVTGADSSVVQVKIGTDPGQVTAHEQNSCANLTADLPVTTALPTIGGALSGHTEVCTGTNSATLTLGGARGSVLNWLSTTDGVHYTTITDTTYTYTATNLTDTTTFRALVQNSESCAIDTASPVVVYVDPLTVGGALSPASMQFCEGQFKDALLSLVNQVGKAVNWQSSLDNGGTWTDFAPAYPDSVYQVNNLTSDIEYRAIVQSGVCPSQNSAPATILFFNTAFPQATYTPQDTLICYGTQAGLNADITSGTSFSWSYSEPLVNEGNGDIGELPYSIAATASPLKTTNYVLSVTNAGCPNQLIDTFHVVVLPPIVVDAGHDTSIVVNQPLQLNASSNDTTTPGGDSFNWTPSTGLDNPNIYDPIALFSEGMDSVRYFITATSQYGCKGTTSILVKIFSTGPDIFVPNAFTPGGATNTIFRPIPVGIQTLQYFRVFNRWGRLVYSTTRMGDGWDGRVDGQIVDSGTYVWLVQGVSYLGKTVFHKGTMILVR